MALEWGLHLKCRVTSTRRATMPQLLGATAIAFILAGPASASVVNYNPAPTTSTGWNKCSGADFAALANDFCQTTAFFEPNSLATEFSNNPGGISVIFGAGFDAWNNTNNKSNNPAATTAQGWTLSSGGDPGSALNLSIAKALQFDQDRNPVNTNVYSGGAQIKVTPNAALLKTLNTAVAADNAAAPVGKKDYQILPGARDYMTTTRAPTPWRRSSKWTSVAIPQTPAARKFLVLRQFSPGLPGG